MRKVSVLCLMSILLLLCSTVFAQSSRIPLSAKSKVADSTGTIYTYEKWLPLISKREYKLQKVKGGDDEYLLVKIEKLSAEANKVIYGKDSPNFIGKKIKFPKMKDIDGDVYDNQFLRDKVVVLNFWFVKCAPCRREIPELNDLYKKYKENDKVVFVAICLDEESDIFDFLKTDSFYYKIIPSGRDLASLFNVERYPTNLVIDQGIVRFSKFAFSEQNISALKNVVEQIVNKREE